MIHAEMIKAHKELLKTSKMIVDKVFKENECKVELYVAVYHRLNDTVFRMLNQKRTQKQMESLNDLNSMAKGIFGKLGLNKEDN